MRLTLYILVAMALLLTACAGQKAGHTDAAQGDKPAVEPVVVDDPEAAWVEGNNRFGANLYSLLTDEHSGENLCYSPVSAYFALGMLLPGAVGEAHTELAAAMQANMPEQQYNEAALAMLTRYINSVKTLGVIELANSAWYQKDYPIEALYRDTVRKFYVAAFEPCDFKHNAEGERVRINAWCDEKTHGRIPEPLPPLSVDDTSRLVLVNATYLKQYWRSTFEGGMTIDRPFTLESGVKVETPTMHNETRVLYRETRTFQSIELPYKDKRFSILFVLPAAGVQLSALEQTYVADGLDGFAPERDNYQNTDIALPKFEFKNDFSLNVPLQKLGVKRAFAPGGAFMRICKDDQLYVDLVFQSTFIKVDEEGAEAAAVTVVGMKTTSAGPHEKKRFRADHPFLFFLRDIETGAVLFMGRVMDPTKE